MDSEIKPHENCKPAESTDDTGVSWCAYHNQSLLYCQAEMEQGAPEPTRHETHYEQRLRQFMELPTGYRLLVVVVDPLDNLAVQALDKTGKGFATWEIMGIVEFLRTQIRLSATQEIIHSERQTPVEEPEPTFQ